MKNNARTHLETEFIQMCQKNKGKISHRLGHIDCDFSHKPDWTLYLSMSTGVSKGSKPYVKATVGPLNEVEMYNFKSISSRYTPNRIQLRSEEGYIMTIRPDIGLVTFSGNMKGAISR